MTYLIIVIIVLLILLLLPTMAEFLSMHITIGKFKAIKKIIKQKTEEDTNEEKK